MVQGAHQDFRVNQVLMVFLERRVMLEYQVSDDQEKKETKERLVWLANLDCLEYKEAKET